jgi:hypothetical protein
MKRGEGRSVVYFSSRNKKNLTENNIFYCILKISITFAPKITKANSVTLVNKSKYEMFDFK